MTKQEKVNFAKEIERESILLEFCVKASSQPLNKTILAIAGLAETGIVIYFAVTGNYLAALFFWIAGVTTGFTLYDKYKNPRDIVCKIRTEGVQVNASLYPYETLKSFWIFYDPPHQEELSLRSKAPLTAGYIKIPLGEADPVRIREALLRFLPEKRQQDGLADTLARVIGL